MWDIKTPTAITLRMVLRGHEYGVGAVELTEANIITGSADRTIKVYMSLCVIILILHHYDF